MKQYLTFLIMTLMLLSHPTCSFKSTRRFLFRNNCQKTIWVGAFGVPLMSRTGWEMPPNSEEVQIVNANTVAIRFWARTGCVWRDNKFVCSTGDCGAPLNNFGV